MAHRKHVRNPKPNIIVHPTESLDEPYGMAPILLIYVNAQENTARPPYPNRGRKWVSQRVLSAIVDRGLKDLIAQTMFF